MKKSLIYVFLLVGLLACKKEVTDKVDQDKIFTYYQLIYDQNTDVTTAKATFQFSNLNGTKLMLSDPSTVTVDGEAIDWSNENGFYQKEFSGLKPTAVFNWVDLDGNSFSDTVEIRDIDFPNPIPTFSHDDPVAFFTWAGSAPLEMDESVVLTIDGQGETDTRNFFTDTVGDTDITIDSLRLSQVDSGTVTLILEKFYRPEILDGTSAGGLLEGTYRPTDRTTLLD